MPLKNIIAGLKLHDDKLYCHGIFTGIIAEHVIDSDTDHPTVEYWSFDTQKCQDQSILEPLRWQPRKYPNVSFTSSSEKTYWTDIPILCRQETAYGCS